jgi:putative restriction endonuclease
MKMKTVVAALIEKDGKYLLAKRNSDKPLGDLWEFPGGKVEIGESEPEALKREIIEEFNAVVDVNKLLAEAKIDDKTVLKLYACRHNLGGYHTKEHSEIAWLDNINAANNYELAPADIKLLEQITNTTPRLHELQVGKYYTNNDIHRIFSVSTQSGMRRSKRTNSLVLVARHDHNNPYEDKWGADGIIHYTGMGLSGNQSINYSQNKTLAESRSNGINVYLFESNKPNEYTYSGKVELASDPYYKTEEDENGHERQVVKFPLRICK